MSEPAESDSSLLVVVLDINTYVWTRSTLSIDHALQQMIIFINAYLALKPENKLVVLASNKRECRCLYPSTTDQAQQSNSTEEDMRVYEQFRMVDVKVIAGVQAMLHQPGEAQLADNPNIGIEERRSLVAQAMSRALCHINRIANTNTAAITKFWSRILVLSAADDSPREYISMMNSIFAAQKMGVLIDICKISGSDSVFLQQAADITGGNYVKVDSSSTSGDSLLQTLMFTCLPDHYTRSILTAPTNEHIDFRATCFCHKRVVDIGYVCSVCLSIFCDIAPVCSTCQTKFSFKIVRSGSSAQTNGQSQEAPSSRSTTDISGMSHLTLS